MAAEVVLVTGFSGAGKEGGGGGRVVLVYPGTDNLPAALLPQFLQLAARNGSAAAAVVDARGTAAEEVATLTAELRSTPAGVRIIFLDADDSTIVHRFSETRKTHPLDSGSGLGQALATERTTLGELRELAQVIDTSGMRVDQLVRRVQELVTDGRSGDGPMPVTVGSFGFKYGVPLDADWVIDVRFLENPFYIDDLRPLSGHDQRIRDFLLRSPLCVPFLVRAAALILRLISGYREWGKPSLYVAIGCTGGRHRLVGGAGGAGGGGAGSGAG